MSRPTRRVRTILIEPGPFVSSEKLPESAGVIKDLARRKAWMAPPAGYTLFKKSLLGQEPRPSMRFLLFNRDKDEPIHLNAGPKWTDRQVKGIDDKKVALRERWAGEHRVTAAERFDLQDRFAREEQSQPDQKKQSDWLYWAVIAALMSGVLIAMLKFGLRAIATNGAPAA